LNHHDFRHETARPPRESETNEIGKLSERLVALARGVNEDVKCCGGGDDVQFMLLAFPHHISL
jgi:hypothetical protein